ncbi:MAG: 23S rRNA (guanosine(2251)-2'-O)-methyltransferase RlmB, partial [Clostridia bacterium]|nr:23S rRNA (guanosine(2251)-2'-O)-methyltransferase RlmB [Clostridia bacterium]
MGFDKENNAQSERDSNLIIGRNAVSEALRSGRNIDTLLVVRGERNGSVGRIIAECKEKGVVIKEVDKKKLDFMCGQGNHQGVAAYAAVHEYSSVEDIFALAEERGEAPFIILCDELEDPHNLGAIIRTAETAGAHGVIIPKRRNASLTWAVGKASAGAVEYVPVARVGNLASTIDDLKKRGLWVYTADMDGQNWCETDFS